MARDDDGVGQAAIPTVSPSQATVRALRQLLSTMTDNDLVLLQPDAPGLPPGEAALLYRHLTVAMPDGVSVTMVDAGRRIHVLRIPLTDIPVLQTTDLRDLLNGARPEPPRP